MSKLCQYMFVAGPKKGNKCNKLLRKPDGYCYRHKKNTGSQTKYKELIDDMKEEKLKKTAPKPVAERKRLSNMVNKAIAEVLTAKQVEDEPSEESISIEEESIEDLQTIDIKAPTPKVLKKTQPKEDLSGESLRHSERVSWDTHDDELIDQFQEAVEAKSPNARRLLTQMLKKEIITDEEYDKLLEQVKI